ncbi:hypothetical protein GTP58_24555 [Duganella sp. CY15W]|uniref:helix-turn-helix domain-containing protein n=1 Tax=Duganella sp. CY15W TaxID=2692172 RepID=UPI0013699A63|nr:helix-turn-helix domain-containing protein [Duganella sp. CY15W]MYM31509.1 hypothetical protein [Duganella sp. CY15W]
MENLISRLEEVCAHLATATLSGQTALVEASGASKSVVNQWLSGKIKSIDIRFALAIERNSGYSHVWLMTGEGEKKLDASKIIYVDRIVQQQPTYSWISTAEARLLTLYRTTDDDGRDDIMATAEESKRIVSPRLARNEV